MAMNVNHHLLRNGIGAAIAYKLGLEEARVIIADNGASLAF
jgi:NAD(P)-dependent dehydrogenase (short-subunit alcohol dehydrogenase family)